jgi:glyoxylase-like metal-dependent hydrolase (beta-lactamase superfamily II)
VTSLRTRLALLALFPLSIWSLSSCSGDEALAEPTKGSQATAWGPAYPNMPDIVPPNVRQSEYAAVAASEMGPPIDPAKGYRTENFGGGVHMVTEGSYQAMLVVSDAGVILVDAPPPIGSKLLNAVQDVAPGAKIVAMVYSHAHVDHIGYAGEIVKSNPVMAIVAHEETRKLLVRAKDPARPVPTRAFDTQDVNFPLTIGNQTLLLQYPGPNHEPGNIGIYHAGQKVLMLVDVIFPGWMMWRRFAVSHDIPGYFDLVKTMNARWDFDTLIAGHVGRAGTKADVAAQLEFMTDLHGAAAEALATVKPGETLHPKNASNTWAFFRDYIDRVTNHCVNKVSPKWGSRLAAYDVWIYDQCMAMEQSLRIDGPSLK